MGVLDSSLMRLSLRSSVPATQEFSQFDADQRALILEVNTSVAADLSFDR
jgi:hypothetical protein